MIMVNTFEDLKKLFEDNLSLQSYTFDSEAFLKGSIDDSYIIVGFEEEFIRWEPRDRKIRSGKYWRLKNRFKAIVWREPEFFGRICRSRPEKEITLTRSEVMNNRLV